MRCERFGRRDMMAVMPQAAKIRLYELVLENGRSSSPYVWRTRYALAHKGMPFESVPLGFVEIPTVLGGRFKTVPIIEDGGTAVADSWDIAEYLDRAHPGPLLFSGPAENAMVRLMDAWFQENVLRRMFRIYILDVFYAIRPADRGYFRESREARFRGRSLEDFTANRAAELPELRKALGPLRSHLARHAFLGGSAPNYADYIALGAFQWAAGVSTLPMLAADDSLRAWLDRCLDLYGGAGRVADQKPLFEQP
jgi:glutathione S-transferase